MCQVWHAYPSPCQVYAINQSGFRPETWDGYRFVHGPLDADYPGDKSCKPMMFGLSTLNEKGLVNTGEKDYAERKKACRVKKWRWCASPLLPHVVTYSTPNVCYHTCAMHRITAEDIADMHNLPGDLSEGDMKKVLKARTKAIVLFCNHLSEMRSQQGPLSHKCLIWPACATRGMHAARSAAHLAHVPRVAYTPHAPPLARRMCHVWHAHRTGRPLPDACATCGTHAARSALCLAYVPHVASHRTRRFPARRMCHMWHSHRTGRPLPDACATRGTHTARSALCPAHVPRLASYRTRRFPARRMCRVWPHAAGSALGPAHVPRLA